MFPPPPARSQYSVLIRFERSRALPGAAQQPAPHHHPPGTSIPAPSVPRVPVTQTRTAREGSRLCTHNGGTHEWGREGGLERGLEPPQRCLTPPSSHTHTHTDFLTAESRQTNKVHTQVYTSGILSQQAVKHGSPSLIEQERPGH